jgi:hypothetical protein
MIVAKKKTQKIQTNLLDKSTISTIKNLKTKNEKHEIKNSQATN